LPDKFINAHGPDALEIAGPRAERQTRQDMSDALVDGERRLLCGLAALRLSCEAANLTQHEEHGECDRDRARPICLTAN
jgi:hypothetical protein